MRLWADHGTKILGVIIALLGSLTLLTPDQLQAIFGEDGPRIAVTIAGLLTVLRGFQNTVTQGKTDTLPPPKETP